MRIIAGTRKSLPLKTVPGDSTRPTTDRIKETLFNIIDPYVRGSRFLDLFAGSGGIGLEALSRGAVFACFVEKQRKALACIEENIRFTRFDDRTKVIRGDAVNVFSEYECDAPYDILFMDPPYRKGFEKKITDSVRGSGWITEDTLCIAETAADDDISWTEASYIEVERIKNYKTNMHIFFHIVKGEIAKL